MFKWYSYENVRQARRNFAKGLGYTIDETSKVNSMGEPTAEQIAVSRNGWEKPENSRYFEGPLIWRGTRIPLTESEITSFKRKM